MNQVTQVGSSNALQFLPVKRKRGRPRKDPNLKRVAIGAIPRGFGGRESRSRQADRNDGGDGGMVGQAVTGVIEATFDAGYLLTVRIGNSNTSLRGVVFKPGEFIPITAGNDIAPQAQMIKRNEVYFPLSNQFHSNNVSRGRSDSNGALHSNQGVSFLPQSSATVASKGKEVLPTAVSYSQPGGRGTVVPVVLQPINALNGPPSANPAPPEAGVSREKDVVTAEPLAVVLPQGPSSSSQFWAAKSQQRPSPLPSSNQGPAGSMQNVNDSCHERNVMDQGKGETEGLEQTHVPVGVESLNRMESTTEPSKGPDKSNLVPPTSHMPLDQGVSDVHSPYGPMSMKNYGTGRMSELLQAVQENVRPLAAVSVESQEFAKSKLELRDDAKV